MNKIVLCLCIPILLCQWLHGQNRLPKIRLNHVYLVLDSATYNHLFDSAFIAQTIGKIKTSAVTTTNDSWSGKYLFGKNGYFEFFSDQGYKGASVGDCGLGFMTLKSGDIWTIQ